MEWVYTPPIQKAQEIIIMSKPVHFEKSMEELEEIVQKLEAGNLPLETSLKYYEKGIGLARKCEEILSVVKQKIEIIENIGRESRDE